MATAPASKESPKGRGLSGRLADTDIRLLHIFRTVVECGGFMAAEVDLNISRAAISVAMSDLEQRLSLRLCQRGRGGFSVTEQGQEVYDATLQLLSALEDFRTRVNGLHARLVGELNIGITDNLITMPRMKITHALKRLKEEGPDVCINISMIPPAEIEIGILDGHLHTGVIPVLKPLKGLLYLPLYEEVSNLYCCDSHPLYGVDNKQLTLAQIEATDMVLPAYPQSPEIKVLHQGKFSTATATDREGIAFLILTGQYIGFLPNHYADQWVRQGKLRALLPEQMHYSTDYAVITRKSARPNRVLQRYLELL